MVPFPPLSKFSQESDFGIEAFLLKGNGAARVEFLKEQHVAIVRDLVPATMDSKYLWSGT